MIALGLFLSSTALAHGETFAGLSGVFVPTTSYEQIMTDRNASVERSLQASNFIVRTVASASLAKQPTMCAKYSFSNTEDTLFVQCDDHPNIPVYLDGRPTQYPKKDGTYIDVVLNVLAMCSASTQLQLNEWFHDILLWHEMLNIEA